MALRAITKHLKPEAFAKACSEFAAALAKAELDLSELGRREDIDRRTLGRWVERATDRGVDVLALARTYMQAKGKDPSETLAEKVRAGRERAAGDDES